LIVHVGEGGLVGEKKHFANKVFTLTIPFFFAATKFLAMKTKDFVGTFKLFGWVYQQRSALRCSNQAHPP